MTQLQTQPSSFDFDSVVDTINESGGAPVGVQPGSEFNRLLDIANQPNPNTGFTPVGAESIRELNRQIAGVSKPTPDVPIQGTPPSDTFFLSDIGRGALRAFFGLFGDVAAAPEAISELAPGEPPALAKAFIETVTRPISEAMRAIAKSKTLAPDPESIPTLPGITGVKQAFFNPAWWSNRFSEIAVNGSLFMAGGIGTSKTLRAFGVSQPRAARFGKLMSLSMIASAETGGAYENLLKQLLDKGFPENDARDIASRGAVAVGVASTLLEMKMINVNVRGRKYGRLMRLVRGVGAETATEEAQLFANAGVIYLIEQEAEVELNKGLNAMSIFEAGIGATSGALTGPAIGNFLDTSPQADIDLASAEVVKALSEASGLTEMEVQQKIGEVMNETETTPTAQESTPAQDKEPAPTVEEPTPPAAELPAPTREARLAPAEPAAREGFNVKSDEDKAKTTPAEIANEFAAGPERNAALTERVTAAERLVDNLQPGDQIIDEEGEVVGVVVSISKNNVRLEEGSQIRDNLLPRSNLRIALTADEFGSTTIKKAAPTGEALPAPAEPAVGEVVVTPAEPAVTPVKPEVVKLPQATEEGKAAIIQPISENQRDQNIQSADIEALRRQQAKESRVDDLNKMVADNLPNILTKSQAVSLVKKLNNATTPKRLRVVVRQIRREVQKGKTKQAQDRLKKIVDKIDVNKLGERQKAVIQELIDGLDTGSLTDAKRRSPESLQQFVARKGEEAVPQKVAAGLKRLNQRPIGDMNESEATILADELERALKQGKRIQQIHQRRRTRDKKKFIKATLEELRRPSSAVGAFLTSRAKDIAERGGLVNFILNKSVGRDASTLESLIELLSGSQFSQMMDVLYTQVSAAKSKTLGRKNSIMDQQEQLIEDLGLKDTISTWLRPEDTRERRLLESLGLVKPADLQTITLPSGKTIEFYRAERADFIHQLMDAETRGLIIFDEVPLKLPGMAEGESATLSNEDILALVDSATADEIAFANQYFQIANGQEAKDLADSTLKSHGVSLVRSSGHSMRSRAGIEEPTTFSAEQFRQRAIKNVNITKERNPQDKTKPIIITDIFSRMNNWATQHSAVIEMSDTMEQAMSVIVDSEFKAEIVGKYGQPVYDRLRSYYDSIAAEAIGGGPRNSITDRELRPIFGMITKGSLGLRPQVAAYQAASIATMMTELNESDVLASLGAALSSSVSEEINDNSPILRERDEGTGSQFVETSTAADKRTLKKFRSDDIGETLTMGMIRTVDRSVIRIIWEASKRQAARENRTGEDLLRRTAEIAERVVRRTQPTFDVMSITGLALDARTQTFSRYINFFRSQRSKNVDMTKMLLVRHHRGQISTLTMMKSLTLINLAQPLYITGVGWIAGKVGTAAAGAVGLLATGRVPEKDETDDEFKKLMLGYAEASLGNVVFGNTLSGMIRAMSGERAFDLQISPVESIIEGLTRGLFGMGRAAGSDDPNSERVAKGIEAAIRFSESALTARGIPIKLFSKPIRKLFDDAGKPQRKPKDQPRL